MYRSIQIASSGKPLTLHFAFAGEKPPKGARGAEALRRKLTAFVANGAQLGWLLFPEQRAVEIWRSGAEPERLEEAEALEGGDVLPGLQLELEEIWTG